MKRKRAAKIMTGILALSLLRVPAYAEDFLYEASVNEVSVNEASFAEEEISVTESVPSAAEEIYVEPAAENSFTSDFEDDFLCEEITVDEYEEEEAPVFDAEEATEIPVLKSAANDPKGVKVTWGPAIGAVKYRVYRKANGSSWVAVKDVTGTGYVDTTAVSGTTYTYTVRGITGSGSQTRFDTTGLTCKYLATPAVTSTAATAGGTITVKWNAVSGAAKYRVFRKTGTGGWVTLKDVTGTSYVDANVKGGNTYTYTVRAVDAAGTTLSSFVAGSKFAYADMPVLKSVKNDQYGVTVAWNAANGAVKYRVYRKTEGGSWNSLGLTTALTYTDKTAQTGVTYYYTVRSMNEAGAANSYFDTVGMSVNYVAAPAASANVSAANTITVKWNAVSGISKYRIFRKTGNGGWTTIKDVTGTSYVDTTVKTGSNYSYAVRCVDAAGNCVSSFVPTAFLRVAATPVLSSVTNGDGSVTVKWNKAEGAVKYRVFRKTESGSWTTIGHTTGTAFADENVVGGTTYFYTIRCVDETEKMYASFCDTAGKKIIYLDQPAVTVRGIEKAIEVKWNKVAGAVKYRVYRRTESTGWVSLGDISRNYFTDQKVEDGVKYAYTVRAMSGGFYSSFEGSELCETVIPAPAVEFTRQPGTLMIPVNEPAMFTVAVSAEGTCTYQWQKKVGDSYVDVEGATAATFLFEPVATDNNGIYRCVVTCDGYDFASEDGVLKIGQGNFLATFVNAETGAVIRTSEAAAFSGAAGLPAGNIVYAVKGEGVPSYYKLQGETKVPINLEAVVEGSSASMSELNLFFYITEDMIVYM